MGQGTFRMETLAIRSKGLMRSASMNKSFFPGSWRRHSMLDHSQVIQAPQSRVHSVIHLIEVSELGTSLVAQWTGICLPLQGTWVWSLVQEDSTWCRQLTLWATTTKTECWNYWRPRSRARAPQQENLPQWEAWAAQQRVAPGSPQLAKAREQQRRFSTTKNK